MTKFPIEMLRTISGATRFFDSATKQMIDGLWYGYHIAIEELRKRSKTVASAESCVNNDVATVTTLEFSVFTAMPIYLNPLTLSSGFKVLSTRIVDDWLRIEVDEISYRQLYGCISIGDTQKRMYVVSGDQAAAVTGFTTTVDGNPGDALNSVTRYWLVCPPGAEIADGSSAYATTGLSFRVDESVMDIPYFRTRPTDEGLVEDTNEALFKNVDFIFWKDSAVVEFMPDVAQRITDGTVLFAWETIVVNADLYAIQGVAADLPAWSTLRVDNNTAAAAINAAGRAKTTSGNLADHQRGLASAYRMPVADRRYRVVAQVETVGFPVQDGALVTSGGGQFSGPVMIGSKTYPVSANSIGQAFDGSDVPQGSGLVAYPLVPGRYDVMQHYNSNSDWYQTLWVYDTVACLEPTIASIYDVCMVAGQGQVLPSGILETVDGKRSVVHFVSEASTRGVSRSAGTDQNMTKIMCYKYNAETEDYPLYHDVAFPAHDAGSENDRNRDHVVGSLIFMHPKHKTLIMVDDNGVEVRYPLDAPLYSRLNPGDIVETGDILCENLIVETSATMPGMANAVCFKYTDKMMSENCIFEVVQVNQIAEYGKDYPDKVVEVS